MSTQESDSLWMRRALDLAARGEGRVEPNPMVGCVLIGGGAFQGTFLGEGFHAKFGEVHAERAAIADARNAGHGDKLTGSTAYVTLEPCCHHGKTPPCTSALLEIGVARVVVAQRDPYEKVNGRGIDELKAAGIEILLGVEQQAAEELNAPYFKRLTQHRPWVIAKWAMSLDGKIATHTGDSQWISCAISRAYVQQLRGRVDAILVGSGTALADDPLLIARTPEPPPRIALRVILDSRLRLSTSSQLATTARQTPVLICAGPDAPELKAQQLRETGCKVHISPEPDRRQRLSELLRLLASEYSATNILVEGGGELLGSLVELRQIDQCEVFIAPTIIGGRQAVSPIGGSGIAVVSDAPKHRATVVERTGGDTHVRCRLNWDSTED